VFASAIARANQALVVDEATGGSAVPAIPGALTASPGNRNGQLTASSI
jgi:hypothetical protein